MNFITNGEVGLQNGEVVIAVMIFENPGFYS